MNDEWRFLKMAVSDRETVKAELRAVGLSVVRCAFHSFMATAVTSAALVASMWPLEGIDWNSQTISEAYGFFRGVWVVVFLMCLSLIPLYHVSPIAQSMRRLREYDRLSTRELLEIETRIRQKDGGNSR